MNGRQGRHLEILTSNQKKLTLSVAMRI